MFMYFKNFKFNVYRPTISLIVYQTDRTEVLVGLGLDMLGLFPLLVLVLVREMKNEAWMRREREISHWYPSITCNISPSLFHKWCYKETLKKRIMTKAHIHITIYTREVKVDEWGRDLVTPKKEGCLGLCTGEWGEVLGRVLGNDYTQMPLICSIQCPYGLVYTCLVISWAKRIRNTLSSVRGSDSQKYKRSRSIIWIYLSSLLFLIVPLPIVLWIFFTLFFSPSLCLK